MILQVTSFHAIPCMYKICDVFFYVFFNVVLTWWWCFATVLVSSWYTIQVSLRSCLTKMVRAILPVDQSSSSLSTKNWACHFRCIQFTEAAKKHVTNEISLCDLLDMFNQVLSKCVYPKWIGFAADCAEMYVARGGHFVEKSEQVGKHWCQKFQK